MVRHHLALTFLNGDSFYMQSLAYRLLAFPFLLVLFASIPDVQAQALSDHQNVANEMSVTKDPHEGHADGHLEGSLEGKAFSELAHHFAGSLEVMLGLAELGAALQYPLPYWTRFVLPGALSMMGAFPLIWSD